MNMQMCRIHNRKVDALIDTNYAYFFQLKIEACIIESTYVLDFAYYVYLHFYN